MASAPVERRSHTSEAEREELSTATGGAIGEIGRFDLRTYVCGPRMRIFSALKSVLSIVYAALLLVMIVNFKVLDEELEKMDQRTAKLSSDSTLAEVEVYEAVRVAEKDGRAKYKLALWIALVLCFFHTFNSGMTVLFSCLSNVRTLFGHLAHLAWWLVFVATILIPTVTSYFYFALLPRAVHDAFGQLVRTAQYDYNAIILLEMKFSCCSVDISPNISDIETIMRYRPANSNNTCASTPAQDSCTKRLLSYIPGRTRWLWILIAASVPHTAFAWLLVFDLMFILLVWYERGGQPGSLSDQFAKELLTNNEMYRRCQKSTGTEDVHINSRSGSRTNTPPASRKPTETSIRSYGISTPPPSRKHTITRLNSLTISNRERDSLGEATTALLLEAKAQMAKKSPSTQTLPELNTDNHSVVPNHRKASLSHRERSHKLPQNYRRRVLPSNVDANFGEIRIIISEHEEES